ncbi:hypothetical protein HOY82DRAFT_536712 [Tuber indicum]|nr:hypothetical protein HOY82DRAFT_536712 [Tuber indicum]
MSTSTKPTTETVPNKRPRPASRTGSNKKRKTSQNTFSTHWTLSAFFDRPPHRWGILAYLIYQPRETPSHRILDGWRRSLEFIANTDNDQSEGRRSRASELLARFREPAEESDSLDDRPPVTISGENRNVILNGPCYKNEAPEPILTRIGRRISKRRGQISGSIRGIISGSISWCNSDNIEDSNGVTVERTSGGQDDAEGTSGDEDDAEGTLGDEDDVEGTSGDEDDAEGTSGDEDNAEGVETYYGWA